MNLAETMKGIALGASPEPAGWFERAWPGEGAPYSRIALRTGYSGCGRRLSGAAPALNDAERGALSEAGVIQPERWLPSLFGRAALLVQACSETPDDEHLPLVTELFRRGDNHEQIAVLQTLSLLPAPARFVELAVGSCRTNVLDVFEAIACENRYPAEQFPEGNFNQLIMKALFMAVPLGRVDGLGDRRTPELARMAADYASERRAAGRTVPEDIALLVD